MPVSEHYADSLLAERAGNPDQPPLFTIAILQYERRPYLEAVLASLFEQDLDDFEIVVSDDNSPDDSREIIPALLQRSGRVFRYYLQPINLRYDRNLRFCLSVARGRYVFLLGNDDALAASSTLRELAALLRQLDWPDLALTNFANATTGKLVRRAGATRVWPAGPATAAAMCSAFTFVSGLIFERTAAERYATTRWDDSTFYQVYLAGRIIAAGGRLATLDVCAIHQDLTLAGRPAPNYIAKLNRAAWSWQPRTAVLDKVIHLTADAAVPYAPVAEQSSYRRRIAADVLRKSYLFWLLEYRRVANWGYAFGLARGLWPGRWLPGLGTLQLRDRLPLWLQYLGLTVAGLLTPWGLFDAAKRLRRWLKHLP